MTETASQALVNHGVEQPQAAELAQVVIKALAFLHGGRVFYLPKGEALKRALRDSEIWARFNGNNMYELSIEFGLSQKQIYVILTEQRELRRSDSRA